MYFNVSMVTGRCCKSLLLCQVPDYRRCLQCATLALSKHTLGKDILLYNITYTTRHNSVYYTTHINLLYYFLDNSRRHTTWIRFIFFFVFCATVNAWYLIATFQCFRRVYETGLLGRVHVLWWTVDIKRR